MCQELFQSSNHDLLHYNTSNYQFTRTKHRELQLHKGLYWRTTVIYGIQLWDTIYITYGSNYGSFLWTYQIENASTGPSSTAQSSPNQFLHDHENHSSENTVQVVSTKYNIFMTTPKSFFIPRFQNIVNQLIIFPSNSLSDLLRLNCLTNFGLQQAELKEEVQSTLSTVVPPPLRFINTTLLSLQKRCPLWNKKKIFWFEY